MTEIFNDIIYGYAQEISLLALILLYFVTSFFLGKYFFKAAKWIAIFIIMLVIASIIKLQIIPNYYSFNGAFLTNFYTIFLKLIVLVCSFFTIILSKKVVLKRRHKSFNYFTTILLSTLGAMCLICANDFLTMFISLELMNVSTYFLCALSRKYNTKEATIKYVVSGVVASAVMLLGISYIYATVGSLNFDVIYNMLNQNSDISPLYSVGCVLCALGFTFRLGLVPFSCWLPDTFEGSANTTSVFISTVPLVAAFGILSRVIVYVFQYTPMTQAFLFIIGMISIIKGIFGLTRQENLKRFIGYSTIAQSGFILLGFCIANTYATSSSLFYILSYMFMNIGMWAAFILFNNVTGKEKVSDLKGLVYASRSFSLAWVICILSFAGLPVTAGFLAKIYLFESIAKCSELYLIFLIVILIISAIGVCAYFRPIKEIFCIEKNDFYKNPKLKSPKIVLYICTIITIIMCMVPDAIIQVCQLIAYQL